MTDDEDKRPSTLSLLIYAYQLQEHFEAITFWPHPGRSDDPEPAFLPWAIIIGKAEECKCKLRH